MSADLLVSESAYLIYAPACGLVVEAVTQWRDEIRPQSALLIFSSAPQVVLFTDALMAGWGDHVVHLVAADSWSVQKPMLHTYVLEWEAVCRSVSLLASFLKRKSVRLLSDNTSVACYVSKQRGGVVRGPVPQGQGTSASVSVSDHSSHSALCSGGALCSYRFSESVAHISSLGVDVVSGCAGLCLSSFPSSEQGLGKVWLECQQLSLFAP